MVSGRTRSACLARSLLAGVSAAWRPRSFRADCMVTVKPQFYQSLRNSVLGSASPTPEGLSLNSRGCARHERTPGKGTRNACHPGGVVQSPSGWAAWYRGNPSGVRVRCGGSPGVALVPRSTPGYSR